ncbi:MBL fold metallo-hydrolase, partial [Clostridium perfringens]|uniref:MBL fold metallo-hydrolase n=1 Tax=Clostridium perfringens TaxID=1502 RepID=UPI0037548F8B
AIFITHLHPDHTQALRTVARTYSIPVYVSEKAVKYNAEILSRINISPSLVHAMGFETRVDVGSFSVTSFATAHDSVGSVGYSIAEEGRKATIIT